MEHNTESGLLAIASDDFIVRVFDITTKEFVRKFEAHTACISAMVF